MVAVVQDPLFRSVRGALTFAYNFSHGTMKASALAGMMGGARPKGRGLGGLDGAAQSGMIKFEVQQLGTVASNILAARFEVQRLPCACKSECCNGWRVNPDWMVAVMNVSSLAHGQVDGLSHNIRVRIAIVKRYFGAKDSLGEIARQCGIDRDTASVHANKANKWLTEQERMALYAIEDQLKAGGVVE